MTDRYASLKQGLVGCWIPSISGSGLLLPDLSGRGNNGSLVGMDASDWVSSQYGRALDFDGSNDRVNLGTQSLSNSARTVSGWMRLNATGINHALLDGSTDTSIGRGLHLRITNGNVLRFWNYDANANATGATVLSSGIWYNVCGTFDGATTNRVYLNGVFDGSNTGDSTNSVSGSFNIGASTLLNYFTNGSIDDVRIYSRALSEPEIRLLATRPGIGLRQESHRQTFYQFPSGARRKRILTGMP